MSWWAIADWAEEMDQKVREERRTQLKLAADHFGINLLDVLSDKALEEELMARYAAVIAAEDHE
jgi:hypothetical protein